MDRIDILPRHVLKDVQRGSTLRLTCSTCDLTWEGISKSQCIELMEDHHGHSTIWVMSKSPKVILKRGKDSQGLDKIFYVVCDADGRATATGMAESPGLARTAALIIARQQGLEVNVVFSDWEHS